MFIIFLDFNRLHKKMKNISDKRLIPEEKRQTIKQILYRSLIGILQNHDIIVTYCLVNIIHIH